ncbi:MULTISPECIES: hypothetical protein [Terrabacteria group]|uniref:hypothetical protein n=1 Tax=Bacillati TaxID=1783272 RepID=UPI0035E2D632
MSAEAYETPDVDCQLVCHTEGCPNNGRVLVAGLSVNTDGIWRAACGLCDQPITDIVPIGPAPEEPDPAGDPATA